jgi:hypothetical protein
MISAQQRRSTTDVGHTFLVMSVGRLRTKLCANVAPSPYRNASVHVTAFRQTRSLFVYRRSDEVSGKWKQQSIVALEATDILNKVHYLKLKETTEF